MRRAKRILLVAGVLLVNVSMAEAGLFGSRKADPSKTVDTAAASAIALSAVEIDGSRVLLRTNGAPAFTSYSPSPGVFIVDLTDTSRSAGVAVPATLPPAVSSITADEVVEMGSRLTRITFRLAQPMQPEVTTIDKAVVITIPATAIPIETAAAPSIEALPPAVPVAQNEEPTVIEESPAAPVAEPVVEEITDAAPAVPRIEEVLPRARAVRGINAVNNDGNVEVRIAGDGQFKYKAFRLENPSRLVIDLDGVKNAAAKSSVSVDDDVVKRVRVAQFQPNVARVVVDLTHKAEYDISTVGEEVRVAFGPSARASVDRPSSAPATQAAAPVKTAYVAPVSPKPQPAAPRVTPAPAPAQMEVVAESIPEGIPTIVPAAQTPEMQARSWAVPEPASKGARSRITPAVDQAPAQRPPMQEDVFSDAAVQQQQQPQQQLQQTQQQQAAPTSTVQNLSGGSRTLSGGPRTFNGEPLSLNLKDADIKDVLRTFAELTGLNIAIDPGVSGSVTVDFVDVPWDQALDLILRQNNLTFTLEGNVMRIGTIERIAAETAASRRLEEEERLRVPLTTLSIKLSYARATEVQGLLRDIASPRARIIVDQRTNQIIISEIPEVLRTMQNLIVTVDIPSRQVMIEARIVETLRSFQQLWGFTFGFNGSLDPALGTGTGLVFPNRIGFSGGPFNFAPGPGSRVLGLTLFDVLGTFDLNIALHATEVNGWGKVVSAPRVTTQDNQAAEIQSGFQIPYQTRVNFTTTVSYLDATLRLSVTPQITEAGTVIMDIAVQKNEPAVGLAIEGSAGTPLTTRQARTRLMVRDGGTAVIAGIFTTRDNRNQSRVPVLHQIPVLGALFRTHRIETSNDELLIFITPRIVRG
ncbi:MAG TPA: type IV pilus secretin PilQ [Thermoanaerobaculia bacterium]|nr:type IV pilus secretin PilQ [Thermoanaerobaculia bacterium]